MNRDPVPSHDDCLGDLLREEQRLLTQSTMEQQLASPAQAAFTAQAKSKGRDYGTTQCYSCKGFGHIATHCPKKFCNYCKKSGHIIKDCPIRRPRKQESAYSTFVEVSSASSSPAPVAATHASAPADSSSTTLTLDMVQQIIISAFSALGISGKPQSSPNSWLID